MNLYSDTYLPDILNGIAQGLLVPTMAVIIILILLTLFFIGQILVETFTERRHYRQNMPEINEITDAPYDEIVGIIEKSELLNSQKAALITVGRNMGLPEDPLFAMAQTQITRAEKHYQRRVAWSDTISKIGPMLGLMGTLIPLGPGIVALGQGNTVQLSASLGIAFDATVCGLVCAVVALIISKIRGGWYSEYISTLEALMTCVLDKASEARKEGVKLPTGYSGNPLKDDGGNAKSSGDAAGANNSVGARTSAPAPGDPVGARTSAPASAESEEA